MFYKKNTQKIAQESMRESIKTQGNKQSIMALVSIKFDKFPFRLCHSRPTNAQYLTHIFKL